MAKITETNPNGIMWLQVCSLAGMQGAITLCWLIYNLYIPQLLVGIGLNQDFAIGLLIVENTLAVVIEPLMGGLSDDRKRWVTNRFPFISVGVILSSAFFIVIPAIVTFFSPGEATRGIFLFVVIAWSIAMAVFRSPAIALLGKYAGRNDLPLAASLLTLVGGLIAAFRPISTNFILGLGAVFAFALSSFVLLAAAFLLRFVNPPEKPIVQVTEIPNISEQLPRTLFLLLGTGFSIAWGSRLLIDVLGKLLKIELNTNNIDGMMFIISLSLAFAALPAGAFAIKIGNRKAMVGGSCVISILMLLMLFFGAKVILIFLSVVTFSLILNGAIPFALSLVSAKRAGLAIGMYFAGIALGGALFTAIFPQLATLSLVPEVFIGAVAFLAAGTCVTASHKKHPVLEET
ncbi:MFS transporter [Scytonema hofmannii FACHB-248]|uniref:MFS transporter n=1 Tax=Scytonema hofmannii FACHB-248 TaxID=1842502 RepID=A0ABR8GPH4_9CYAN|nr:MULTISPECIES: MFS transporter [Nostocales]MBD2605035.1 MFS transporter [Scytonema hofmannii FACHB-248]